MATQPLSLSYAIGLPPRDAVAYFESKGHKITWDWREMEQAAHAQAFTVAKAGSLTIQETIRTACLDALKEGKTESWFIKHLEPKLRQAGWWGKQERADPRTGEVKNVQLGSHTRLTLIYQQNLQTAYMAGRYKAMLENVDARPWWQYSAVMDRRTRPSHAALNGQTFRFDDPFWSSHYPPNGFRCRCSVRALSNGRMEAEGAAPESSEGRMVTEDVTTMDRATGQEITQRVTGYKDPDTGLTTFTDAGFSANPGAAAFGTDMNMARRLSLVQDDALRAQAVQALNQNPFRREAFATWARGVLESGRGGGADAQVVHFLRNEVADFLRERGADPVQVAVVSARRLLHAESPKHKERGTAPGSLLPQLPALMDAASMVLWDTAHNNAIYVVPLKGGQSLKVVLDVPASAKDAKKLPGVYDTVINAMRVDAQILDPDLQEQYELLWKAKN